ncbi:hypothetical protein CK203_115724 [Vitis vinifera]|uniref:Phytocyanin domain-containing protein n=1 Tax=Vitis vinifera TaxID=29760 RepID=A0A438CQR2_VITVI|nr:hypothetical protein CK203_115724 [Vitis vinifera]
MASKLLNIALAVFAIVLPAVAMATEFTVGDDQGWTINFDYEAWAKDKVFRVGDELAAKSPVINSLTFSLQIHGGAAQCLQSEWKWYICGVNDHCANYGQKLAITVLEEWASPAPAPPLHHHSTRPSSAYGISVSGY